jgi:hypothetical protein
MVRDLMLFNAPLKTTPIGVGGRDDNKFSHVLILTKASTAVQFPTVSKMIGLTPSFASLSQY